MTTLTPLAEVVVKDVPKQPLPPTLHTDGEVVPGVRCGICGAVGYYRETRAGSGLFRINIDHLRGKHGAGGAPRSSETGDRTGWWDRREREAERLEAPARTYEEGSL